MPKRLKLGDIIEIPTKKGLAYGHFCFFHRQYGHLVRALPGFFKHRPEDFATLAGQTERFVAFVALNIGLREGTFSMVANVPPSKEYEKCPKFRWPFLDPFGEKITVVSWSIWDGVRKVRVRRLSPKEARYPVLSIWDDIMLRKRIETDWVPTPGIFE